MQETFKKAPSSKGIGFHVAFDKYSKSIANLTRDNRTRKLINNLNWYLEQKIAQGSLSTQTQWNLGSGISRVFEHRQPWHRHLASLFSSLLLLTLFLVLKLA